MAIENNMITTGLEIPGYSIVQSLGIVRGTSICSEYHSGTTSASFKMIFKSDTTGYITLYNKTRNQAFDAMMQQARLLGANAIIGMRYDANQLVKGVSEMLAYGTAVVVEKR